MVVLWPLVKERVVLVVDTSWLRSLPEVVVIKPLVKERVVLVVVVRIQIS